MKRVYRILRQPYARTPFDGEGAFRFGGRWSSVGTRVAYVAEHLSLAMLEYYVHIDADEPPKDLVVATADIPEAVSRKEIASRQLDADWRKTPPPPSLARIGDEFIQKGQTAALIVPSALAPPEANWLLNPAHADFSKIRLHAVEPFQYDARFHR